MQHLSRFASLAGVRRRFGTSNQLELDSLADWLCNSAVLRRDVVAIHTGSLSVGGEISGQWKEWNRRLRKLARANSLTERRQVEIVIRRAMALAQLQDSVSG